MQFIAAILVISAAIYMANGLCNTCSATTGLACVDKDKFKVCVDGIPAPPAIQCPTGTVCTPNAQVCTPTNGNSTIQSSCERCKKCNSAKTFACTEYNAFSLCYGGDNPTGAEYMCPDNLVCNIDSSIICVDGRTTGLGATCPWSQQLTTTTSTAIPITTTPNPATQSNEYCAFKGFPGRYEITTDSTCQMYISCVMTNNGWTGNLYECPKNTYFNGSTQMCGSTKPSRCT